MEESSVFTSDKEYYDYDMQNSVITYKYIKLAREKSESLTKNDLNKCITEKKLMLQNDLNANFESFYEKVVQHAGNSIMADYIKEKPLEVKIFVRSFFCSTNRHLEKYDDEVKDLL
ncbi:hypothetical protein [Chryseobacterium bernardetii]|uniref:hypothetical protein n=1 Tax=Chryseobacterium bernardetii TaxID=1241978 RepID=UPI003AF976A9